MSLSRGWMVVTACSVVATGEVSAQTGAPSDAQEGTAPALEESMFGTEENTDNADHNFLGDGQLSDSAMEAAFEKGLERREDWLALGGQLYSRLSYYALEEGAPETFALSSPQLVDLYFDARPNDRVRTYVRGRLQHDFSVTEGETNAFGQQLERSKVQLDQLWLKFDIEEVVYVTFGKQPVRWGSSRFWNPTDFLNSQRRDPLAIFDERNGVGLLRFHIPIESLGWNLYAVANLDEADSPETVGGALRAEMLFGKTEIALTYANRHKNPHQVGFDISSALGLFDVRMEVAGLHGLKTPFYRGTINPPFETPREVIRDDEWIIQGTLGVDITLRYSDQDTIILGAEYFYNDAGYKSSHNYPWLMIKGAFTPLSVGRHYAGAYAYLNAPGDWNRTSFTCSFLGNLSDASYLSRLDYQVRVLTFLDINIYGTYHFGQNGDLHYGYKLEPTEVPQGAAEMFPEYADLLGVLEQGINIPRPLFEVGVALRLSF